VELTSAREHFYLGQPDSAFWSRAVGGRHLSDISAIWHPIEISPLTRIATGGSCFAQHLGAHLIRRGANVLDMEPMPEFFVSREEARRWGFGVYSCRYGNIYTSRQLLQLFDEAHKDRSPTEIIWEREGRFYDALRPSVDPVGHDSPETILGLRSRHLAAVREMFASLDLFVFTMGLTECWVSKADGTVYPSAPGSIAGRHDVSRYELKNLRYTEVVADMKEFWRKLKAVNPGARLLLTVSPVAMSATATREHVLVANMQSKSTLRAVAGDLADEDEDVSYFPSYELIASHPSRGMFFEPGLREVNAMGVDFVMQHFFSSSSSASFKESGVDELETDEIELVCDESRLEGDGAQ
jgi:hypothetical protein